MAERDVILTELQLLGQRAYVAGMNAAAGSAERAGTAMDTLGRGALTYAKRLGMLSVAAGGVAGVLGLKFNARMEQSEVAYTKLLGSGEKANKMLDRLVKLTTTTPFQLEGVTLAGQQLLGAGTAADKLVPTLTTIADTVASVGGGAAEMDSVTRAIRQMSGAARLNREDLNQLADVGVPIFKLLRKQMGLTADELDDRLRKGTISSGEGVKAVLGALDSEYKGMAKKQAKTFNGQLSNIGDQVNVISGRLFKPMFDSLNEEALPAVARFGDKFVDTLDNNALTADQKWRQIRQSAKTELGPLGDDLLNALDRADIPGKLADALDAGIPLAMDAFANAAPHVASRFVNAWLHADAWTKVLTAAAIAGKFGMFGMVGRRVAGPFLSAFLAELGGKAAAGRIAAAGATSGGVFGRAFGKAAGPLAAVAFIYVFRDEFGKIADQSKGAFGEAWKKLKGAGGDLLGFGEDPLIQDLERKHRQQTQRHGQMDNFPTAAFPSPGANLKMTNPFAAGLLERPAMPRQNLKNLFQIENVITLDGKVVNRSVSKQQKDMKSRR